MDEKQIIEELTRYESELAGILSRFTKTRESVHVGDGDDPIYRQYVRELLDLFNDILGPNNYSVQIINEFKRRKYFVGIACRANSF